MSNVPSIDPDYVRRIARTCLDEDVGPGDLTAGLTPDTRINARLVARQAAVVCGSPFFEAVFRELDPRVEVAWQVTDGGPVVAGDLICEIHGGSRPILSGERSAINLLQTLSGTATCARDYVECVSGYDVRILDTRKTIPGLRRAQKWAVVCGGGYNHRQGLFDGILIKENHLRSGESITEALNRARDTVSRATPLTIEVENLDQLREAVEAGAPRVLLDNFTIDELKRAVEMNRGRAELEASGNVNLDNVRAIAASGVDAISIGALTKDVKAVDLSLLFGI